MNNLTYRIAALIAGLVVAVFTVSAQQIKGTVTDADNQPLIGVSVFVDGTTTGSVTDIDGKYTLDVPSAKGKTLVFSCIGMATKNVVVGNNMTINVVLEEDTTFLDETVVIGYATVKRRDLMGSVTSVDNKTLTAVPVANVSEALSGRMAGVQVTATEGDPDAEIKIRVRGTGSITQDSSPLYIVDGFPVESISDIPASDIQSIDVLKDAFSTAIYGSRGANGVVMITTKRGSEGKGRISVNANTSFQNAANMPKMLNASQYAALSNDMMSASGKNANPEWADPSVLGAGTSWLDEMLGTGIMQNYTVSYAGGNDKSHYYVSGGYLDQTGIVRNVGYNRFTFQSNSDAQVFDWLKFTNSISFSADTKKSGEYGISTIMGALPVFGVKDENGEWTGPEGNSEWYGSTRNVVGVNEMNRSETKGYNILANLTAEISFTRWLKFKSTFGYDAKFWFTDSFTPKYDWKPTKVEQSSRYKSDNKSFTYLWDNYFLFDKTFAGSHRLGIMAGASAQWNKYDWLNTQKNDFMFDNIHEMDNGLKMYEIGGNMSEWSLFSFMARVNYSYADKYLLTATVRRDGSSRFGPESRWGTFPSMSLAWRMSKEDWFPQHSVVNDLKIRAGYGVTGSQASVGNYGYLALYDMSIYSFGKDGKEQSTLFARTLSNPSLHWEEVAQTNFGVDASFLDSRIQFSVDAYLKDTRDMLVKASIPITSGFEDTSTTYTNAGKVRNKGVELSLHSVNLAGEWNWETDINATYNTNKIIDLNSDVPNYINQVKNSYVTMLANGYPINVFYGYVTDGIFQNEAEVAKHAVQPGAEPGDIRFRDLNNDGVINDSDRTVIGNPNPTWLFSMNNRVEWHGLELSVYLQGVAGNKIYNANNIDNIGMASATNQTTAVLGRWTGEGTSNTMPRAVYGDPNQNCRVSDRFVENGSYLRVKNITLAYSFPEKLLRNIHLEGLRVALSCENVATFTTYSGFDPEVSINGIDASLYPIPRTFSVGINVNF